MREQSETATVRPTFSSRRFWWGFVVSVLLAQAVVSIAIGPVTGFLVTVSVSVLLACYGLYGLVIRG